jgi:aspartyl-tRNA(Asn)/glutamyl-tRNA(Gln) amidotransferase subunit A
MDLSKLSIKEAREKLKSGEITSFDLTKAVLKNIEEKNGKINAYLEVYEDVLEQAKIADERIKNGEDLPLLGIPIGVKDNILIKGRVASSASKILKNYKATYDSTVIKKLKGAGAIFIGRTNMDEFAMGGSTENSAYGPTRNPYDDNRVAGGSSGGSAGALAMGGAIATLGTDTGGSVRQPASFCGVVGLKPTYGAISRFGLMAMGSSLDQAGPITRTVSDSELLFNLMAGEDVLDSTTIKTNKRVKKEKKDIVIGVPWHFLKEGLDESVSKNLKESIKKLEDLGFKTKEIELPNIKYSLAVYYIIMPAESSTNLARYDGMRYGERVSGENLLEDYLKSRGEGFGKEVRRRILLGTYVLSAGYYDAYYNKAQLVRGLLKEDFAKAFKDVDVILTPTSPIPAFKVGEKADDPLSMYLADIFTVTANLVGIPAISVPSGFSEVDGKKLPIGMQFMANYLDEDTLFSLGKTFLGE